MLDRAGLLGRRLDLARLRRGLDVLHGLIAVQSIKNVGNQLCLFLLLLNREFARLLSKRLGIKLAERDSQRTRIFAEATQAGQPMREGGITANSRQMLSNSRGHGINPQVSGGPTAMP